MDDKSWQNAISFYHSSHSLLENTMKIKKIKKNWKNSYEIEIKNKNVYRKSKENFHKSIESLMVHVD